MDIRNNKTWLQYELEREVMCVCVKCVCVKCVCVKCVCVKCVCVKCIASLKFGLASFSLISPGLFYACHCHYEKEQI